MPKKAPKEGNGVSVMAFFFLAPRGFLSILLLFYALSLSVLQSTAMEYIIPSPQKNENIFNELFPSEKRIDFT